MKINNDLLTLSEAIRVEGYLMKENYQGAAISNKDINILNLVNKAYSKLFPNRKTCKHLVIVLYLINQTVKILKIVNTQTKENLKFHIDKNNRLMGIQSLQELNFCYTYNIITSNSTIRLRMFISKLGIVTTKCIINSTGYITLQFYNAPFVRFLNDYCKIPIGIGSLKSYCIYFPYDLKNLTKNQIKKVVDIVISCEGCIFYGGLNRDRVIRIKLASREYLENFSHLLNTLRVYSQPVRKTSDSLYCLDIRRRRNFRILYKDIYLTSRPKYQNLKRIILSYSRKRYAHFEANINYLTLLHKYGPTSGKQIAHHANRKVDTVVTRLNQLSKMGYVNKKGRTFTGFGSTAWIFKVTAKGREYLRIMDG